jgi:hypothetical protein
MLIDVTVVSQALMASHTTADGRSIPHEDPLTEIAVMVALGSPVPHPHVCSVINVLENDTHIFIVLELLGGASWAHGPLVSSLRTVHILRMARGCVNIL